MVVRGHLVMLFLLAPVLANGAEKSRPFRDKPHVIPGKIEAEHYDEGAAEVAYHDSNEINEGVDYRGKTQVDIEPRKDASNGHGVGWTRQGEWLLYTVDVRESGTYRLESLVASNGKGGTFHLEIDGHDVSGPIDVPDTGGWQTLKKIEKRGISLKAGRGVLKVSMDTEGPSGSIADIDYLTFVREKP